MTGLALIVMPLVTAEILRALGNYTKQELVDDFGVDSQVIFGGLGVIIHELAHLITAVIFCHHIDSFKLLEPRSYQVTETLGYVNHSWRRDNIYESLGNFFIGLAPCFVCSEVLWLLHGYLFNNQALNYGQSTDLFNAMLTAANNVEHPFGPPSWKLILYLIVIIMIASTGYGLSNADMTNVYSGLPYWVVIVILFYVIATFMGYAVSLTIMMWQVVVLWLTFLGSGLIYLITSLLIIKLVNLLEI